MKQKIDLLKKLHNTAVSRHLGNKFHCFFPTAMVSVCLRGKYKCMLINNTSCLTLMCRFHSEILASLNFNNNKISSPGLERTIHCNVVLSILQHNNIFQDCWKNTISTCTYMVILKSRGQVPKQRDKSVPYF